MSVVASKLKYDKYGEPVDVVKLCKEEVSDPVNNEVLVKILVSPINPADINTIQGTVQFRPPNNIDLHKFFTLHRKVSSQTQIPCSGRQ